MEIAKQLFELYNRHERDAVTQLYAENAEFLDPSFGTTPVRKTRRETAEKHREMARNFPDIRDDVKYVCPSGANVTIEFVSNRTAPDGTSFVMPICSISTFENG